MPNTVRQTITIILHNSAVPRHCNAYFTELKNVIRLVLEDTDEAKETLRRRHRAHRLQGGEWERVVECHVGNAGDWLAVWIREDGTAWFLRTGTHEEIFGN